MAAAPKPNQKMKTLISLLASGVWLLGSAQAGITFNATNDTSRPVLVALYATNASGQYTFGGTTTVATNSNSTISTNAAWSGVAIINAGLTAARISTWSMLANTNGAYCSYMASNSALVYYTLIPGSSTPGAISQGGGGGSSSSPTAIGPAAYYFGTNTPNGNVAAAIGSVYSQLNSNQSVLLAQWIKLAPSYTSTNWSPALALLAPDGSAVASTSFVYTAIATAPTISATQSGSTLTVNASNTVNLPNGVQAANTNDGINWGFDPVLGLNFGAFSNTAGPISLYSVPTNKIPAGVLALSPNTAQYNNRWFTNNPAGTVLISSGNAGVWVTNFNGYWHACTSSGTAEQATNATLYGNYIPAAGGGSVTILPPLNRGPIGLLMLNDTNVLPPASVIGAGNVWGPQPSNGIVWFRYTADGSAITDSHVP
jgi:hypothetical protein